MLDDLEAVLAGHRGLLPLDQVIVKLLHAATSGAHQVIVVSAIIQLVDGPA
ncbi:hypothetical protein BURPS305_2184 [Burkholderia pseudomallei 305]|nr:hypothetical protein BURPS305_2184 [Burkholderia pseudomallei 305]